MADDRKIGKAIVSISYWIYAIKRILLFSAIALVILLIFGGKWYFAPLIGIGVFMVFRGCRLFCLKVLFKFLHWANKE